MLRAVSLSLLLLSQEVVTLGAPEGVFGRVPSRTRLLFVLLENMTSMVCLNTTKLTDGMTHIIFFVYFILDPVSWVFSVVWFERWHLHLSLRLSETETGEDGTFQLTRSDTHTPPPGSEARGIMFYLSEAFSAVGVRCLTSIFGWQPRRIFSVYKRFGKHCCCNFQEG